MAGLWQLGHIHTDCANLLLIFGTLGPLRRDNTSKWFTSRQLKDTFKLLAASGGRGPPRSVGKLRQ